MNALAASRAVARSRESAWSLRLAIAGLFLAAGFLAIRPLLQPGLPLTTDLMYHVLRAVQLEPLLRSGWLYPRWAPDMAYGYGFPFFNYYAPLTSYLIVALHLAGLSYSAALKVALLGVYLAYGPSMYIFARRFLPPLPATVAAVAYMYVPFRFRELYVQGDIAQHIAFALVPLVFAGVYDLTAQFSPRRFLMATLLTAALVLTHNITAYIVAPFLVLYAAILAISWGWRRLLPVAASQLSAVALTAFFWLPALAEKSLVQIDRLPDFIHQFVSLQDLLAASPVVDLAEQLPKQPPNLGLPHLFLAALTLFLIAFWFRLERAERIHLLLGWLLLLASIFLMLPASIWVWTHVPFLRYLQYPWRFRALAGFSLSILVGLAISRLLQVFEPRRLGHLLLVPLVLLALIVPHLVHTYVYEPFQPYDVHSPADILRYEIETHKVGTTASGEFYPIWVSQEPPVSPNAGALEPSSLPAGATARLIERQPLRQRYQLELPSASTLALNVLYFPNWEARLDGQDVPIRPLSPSGRIGIDLPAGAHELELVMGHTPVEGLAEWLSAMSVLVLAAGLLIWQRRRRRSVESQIDLAEPSSLSPEGPGAKSRVFPQVLLGTLALCALFGLKETVLDPLEVFSYRSAPGEPRPATHKTNVIFGQRIQLLGYDIDSTPVMPGGTAHLTLYWQALMPLEGDLHSFIKIRRRSTGEVIGQTDRENPGTLPASMWRTDRYLRDEYEIPLSADAQPMAYEVVISLYTLPDKRGLPVIRDGTSTGEWRLGLLIVDDGRIASGRVSYPVNWRSDDGAALFGYNLDPTTVAAGDAVGLTLYWRAERQIAKDYTVFVHLLDASGQLVAQADAMPLGGDYRTSEWRITAEIADPYRIMVPPGTPAGAYHIQVGLYDRATGQRLKWLAPDGQTTSEVLLEPSVIVSK